MNRQIKNIQYPLPEDVLKPLILDGEPPPWNLNKKSSLPGPSISKPEPNVSAPLQKERGDSFSGNNLLTPSKFESLVREGRASIAAAISFFEKTYPNPQKTEP